MNFKRVHAQLKSLKERIEDHGDMTDEDEASLREILSETIREAKEEMKAVRKPFSPLTAIRAENDNAPLTLTPDQEARLSIVEKTGTGSRHIH